MTGTNLKSNYTSRTAPGGVYTMLNGVVIAFTATQPVKKEVTKETLFIK